MFWKRIQVLALATLYAHGVWAESKGFSQIHHQGDDDDIDDDDDFNFPVWWDLGQFIRGDSSAAVWGTGEQVALSPDGLVLANGYTLFDHEDDMTVVGFQIETYLYVSQLSQWIPIQEPIIVEGLDDAEGFQMEMGQSHLVVNQIYLDEGCIASQVDSWFLGSQGGRGESHAEWFKTKPSLLVKSPNCASFVGADISIAAEADQLRIAISTVTGDEDGDTTPGKVQVFELAGDDPWNPFWNETASLVGTLGTFGIRVQYSADGNLMAVMDLKSDGDSDDDPDENYTCTIRVYDNAWTQVGNAISLDPCDDFAFSPDGRTIVAGRHWYEKPFDKNPQGHVRAWEYHHSKKQWKQKGSDLDSFFPDPESGRYFFFGHEIAISANGDMVALTVAQPVKHMEEGAFYILTFQYNHEASDWELLEGELDCEGKSTIAMSAESNTLAVGSPNGNEYRGVVKAYTYDPSGMSLAFNAESKS